MGHSFFYLAVVAACLLWSAAFTAAAARTRPGWIRWFLIVAAVAVPVLALAPWVAITAFLAFKERLETNWFAPTLTAAIAAVIGGAWIVRAGLSPRAAPAAATWPVVPLAAGFVLAKAVAFGTLLLIDNAVAAEGRMLRVEAAQIMAVMLPPVPTIDDDAAPLYLRAFAARAADESLADAKSPAEDPITADVGTAEVAAILARHAGTLDLLRRSADKPCSRFVRDWSRPSDSMLLPEVHGMRHAARLLVLAARRAAADGDTAAALRDVVRIHRIAVHAASEPLLISGLAGREIDAVALETLARVLPRLEKGDLPLLDGDSFRDFVATPITYQRAFLGDEAYGLAALGDLADGTMTLESLRSGCDAPTRSAFDRTFALLYRCFLLPAEEAGYRRIMRKYQNLQLPGQRFPEIKKQADEIGNGIKERRGGAFASLMTPALGSVLVSQARGQALHGAATVLVAATRARLQTGSLPGAAADLFTERLAALPIDPFTNDATLRSKVTDDAWIVYSVGPDGEDDGGPPAPGADPSQWNDDVGLRMALPAAAE